MIIFNPRLCCDLSAVLCSSTAAAVLPCCAERDNFYTVAFQNLEQQILLIFTLCAVENQRKHTVGHWVRMQQSSRESNSQQSRVLMPARADAKTKGLEQPETIYMSAENVLMGV